MTEILADEIININERARPSTVFIPKVDEVITKIVGKKVFTTDPKLIKLVVQYRKNKPLDAKEPDNFLYDPNFIRELKKVFE
jgi:hypothetical protein